MLIQQATKDDVVQISEIYKACFPREKDHLKWIQACFNSYPKGVYYTLTEDEKVIGYILWCVKNGFRDKTIVELEQVGVLPNYAGRGFGKVLVKESFSKFRVFIESLGFGLGAVVVTTSEGNYAEQMYRSVLGVEVSSRICNYGSGNELILYKNFDES